MITWKKNAFRAYDLLQIAMEQLKESKSKCAMLENTIALQKVEIQYLKEEIERLELTSS